MARPLMSFSNPPTSGDDHLRILTVCSYLQCLRTFTTTLAAMMRLHHASHTSVQGRFEFPHLTQGCLHLLSTGQYTVVFGDDTIGGVTGCIGIALGIRDWESA